MNEQVVRQGEAIEWIKLKLTEISTKLDMMSNTYISRKEYEDDRKDSDKLHNSYVTKDQFRPYQVILGIMGTAVIGYIAAQILPNLFK